MARIKRRLKVNVVQQLCALRPNRHIPAPARPGHSPLQFFLSPGNGNARFIAEADDGMMD